MASPPYRSPANSPPYPPHTTLPNARKRPSLPIPSPNAAKRRKPSAASTASTHPLRQTSFPPEESAFNDGERSPSVESDVTGVTGDRSAIASGIKRRGKGKRRKRDEEGSVSGGKGTADARSGTGQVEDGGEDEEDEGEGDEALRGAEDGINTEAEKKRLAVLIDSFTPEQAHRYEMYRRAKLKNQSVRKIVNATLSQSVPQSVVTVVTGVSKVFIGLLIERARDVQDQYANTESPPSIPSSNPTSFLDDNKPESTKKADPGPLLPDHFREALRRWKKDGEGGGAGFGGLSLECLGVQGSKVAGTGGKRMFK